MANVAQKCDLFCRCQELTADTVQGRGPSACGVLRAWKSVCSHWLAGTGVRVGVARIVAGLHDFLKETLALVFYLQTLCQIFSQLARYR